MAELNPGDVIYGPIIGKKHRILDAVTTDSGRYYWLLTVGGDLPTTRGDEIETWPRVKPFFEEKKEYQSKFGACVVTVWHVHRMGEKMVAIVQTTGGIPLMLKEDDFDDWVLR